MGARPGQGWRGIAVGLIGLLGLMLGMGGCSSATPAPQEIRIGVVVAPIGSNVASTRQAATLAVREVNATGGLMVGDAGPRPVTLVFREIADSPEEAVAAAQSLINQEGVVALVGPQSSRNAIPVAMIAERAAIPMISPWSTNPATTAGKHYVFRAAFIDAYQGGVMARFAREELASQRAAVLFDISSEYNRGVAEIFRHAYEGAGGRVVAFEGYTSDERDFAPYLARIAAAEPDVLFLPNYAEAVAAQVVAARAQGVRATLLGSDGWDPSFLAALPEIEGAYYSHHWHPEPSDEQARAFVQAYQASFGEPPNDVAALTYDAFGLLFQAIRAQGAATPEAIRAGLAEVGRYQGVSGQMLFSGTGDPAKSVLISRFQDGQSLLFKVVDPQE